MTDPSSLRPHQFGATTAQHQLPHNQLVDFLHREIEKTGTGVIAVLIMELKRVNRIDAITGGISMQTVMKHTDQHLDQLLRDADRYANFSGEQICLVLPGLASKEQGVLAAIRIISELQKPYTIGEYPIMLRPHIGIATYPEHGRDAGQLLMHADIASRIAATDEQGYHVYRPEDQAETETYSGLDIELGKAIKANEPRVC